ncbi:MAG: hypothetical protein EZS28_000755 [Streblomastix strix]|uniref:Uncharacterized protein n=1 Tax=Streblomastix strix TaxID=222440 RepID=A0A5J4X9X8_9EUKA|nr:MAG: hypothetical protein EZS28_000755 [Streblomastix strix]
MIMCSVLIAVSFTCTSLIGFLLMRGRNIPRSIVETMFIFWQYTSTLFFIPMLNVFFGPFSCLFGNESLQCGNIRNGLLMAYGILFIFILVTLTLMFRLFMHPFDIRNAAFLSLGRQNAAKYDQEDLKTKKEAEVEAVKE